MSLRTTEITSGIAKNRPSDKGRGGDVSTLSRAGLFGAGLSGTGLFGAGLSGTGLFKAVMAGAGLSGAGLSGAEIAGRDRMFSAIATAGRARMFSRVAMSGQTLSFIGALLVVFAASRPVSVEAQAWLSDRSRAEGPGIRVGDFELHPGIGVEIGYDSNLYYTSDNPPPRPELQRVESGILRITPHLFVSTRSAPRRAEGESGGESAENPPLVFRAGLWAAYYEFFAAENRRNVSIDGSAQLDILPGRVFSMSISDVFGRSIRPFTADTTSTSTARISNTGGVDFKFSTEGQILQIAAGYKVGVDYFEGQAFRYLNSLTHTVNLQESFRFLPHTGLIQVNTFQYKDYFEPFPPSAQPTLMNDSLSFTSKIGVNGSITNEISLLGFVGYTAGFFDSPLPTYDQDYDGVVLQAQLSWTFEPNANFTLGYTRNLAPSFIGNFSSTDRGSIGLQWLIGGSFMLNVQAGVAYIDFGQAVRVSSGVITPLGNGTNREDIRVDASLFGEYRFTDWLGVSGSFSYLGDFTDFAYTLDEMGTAIVDPAGFNKVELWLGVRIFY